MATASAARLTPQSPVRQAGAHDRLFYGGMAVAMGLTVLAGFASTYYLRILAGGPTATLSGGPFTTLVHVHGALFTTWVLLFVVQTALVSSRRVAVHRRLGVAGGVLAAAMVVAGTSIAIATAARGSAPVGVDPLAFLAIPLFDMVLFTTFVAAALALRRDKETHKRLMLLAYVSIIVAAVARLPGVLRLGPPAFFGLSFLFVVVAAIYDFLSRRRVHKVYLWGGALILISVPVRLAVSETGAWRVLAAQVTGRSGGVPMDATQLKEFGTRYTAAWCSQNAASVAAFFAQDGSLKINDAAPSVGRTAITAAAQGFMTAFPDMVVTMDGIGVPGDQAVFRWTLTGTNTGPGGTGRAVRISGYEEWTIGPDRLIARSLGHFDEADYKRQLNAGP